MSNRPGRCEQCWKVWEGGIKMARGFAQMASESGKTVGGQSAEWWNAKVQDYYDKIRGCCSNDEMEQRCHEITDPELRRMCLGLPAPTQPVPRPAAPTHPPAADPAPDAPEPARDTPDPPDPLNGDRRKPQEEDDRERQPSYPPGGMPQPGEDYGPGGYPPSGGRPVEPRDVPSVVELTAAAETMRNLRTLFTTIGLARMSRIVQRVDEGARFITVHGDPAWTEYANILQLGHHVDRTHIDMDDRNTNPPGHIGTPVEEIVHGYMKLYPDTPVVRSITRAGRAAYDGSLVVDVRTRRREVAQDPERVFQEAVGGYVAHRVEYYTRARDFLGALRARGVLGADQLSNVRDEYNMQMAVRTFGYEDRNGEQLASTLSIPEPMRRVIDEQLLRGQIPDNFDDVEEFRAFNPEP